MTEFYGWPPEAWRTMPWLRFKAWSDRVQRRAIERRNQEARADWRARVDELKRRGG